MRWMWLVVATVLLSNPAIAQKSPPKPGLPPGLPPAAAPTPTQYDYAATLAAIAKMQGAVVASGITWQCQGTRCTTRGPWPAPGVGGCAALAKLVGAVTAYGRPGAQLSPADLASCNQGVQSEAVAPKLSVAPLAPANTAPPASPPPADTPGPKSTPPPSTRSGPVSVRTAALQVTGTGALAPLPPFKPKSVRTATLQVTGSGAAAVSGTFPPKVIRTAPLSATGTGSH
jgi:hypothetical protein